jgi:hypothetical protein
MSEFSVPDDCVPGGDYAEVGSSGQADSHTFELLTAAFSFNWEYGWARWAASYGPYGQWYFNPIEV